MGDKDPGSGLGITPATKVGSMRVTQKRRDSGEKPLSREELMEQAREYNSEIVTHPKHSFETPEDLQIHDRTIYHDQRKPQPKVEKPTTQVQHHICQPRNN